MITFKRLPDFIKKHDGELAFNVQLQPSSLEYKFVAGRFLNKKGTQFPKITLAKGLAFNPEIVEISKIYNPYLYKKFEGEALRMIAKNLKKPTRPGVPPLTYSQTFRFLFHGTRKTDPQIIYNSEDGLDFRHSKEGLMGQGIYFAEDPAYSD